MNALPDESDGGSRRAPRDVLPCAAPAQGLRRLPSESSAIKKRARELGLDLCGITSADPARHAAFYQQWTAEGKAGGKGKKKEKKKDSGKDNEEDGKLAKEVDVREAGESLRVRALPLGRRIVPAIRADDHALCSRAVDLF